MVESIRMGDHLGNSRGYTAWTLGESQNGMFNKGWPTILRVPEIKRTHLQTSFLSLIRHWMTSISGNSGCSSLAQLTSWLLDDGLVSSKIGEHEATQPLLFNPWLNFEGSRLLGQTGNGWKLGDTAGYMASTMRTQNPPVQPPVRLFWHTKFLQQRFASRMENLCCSSFAMIANEAETCRNHELERFERE